MLPTQKGTRMAEQKLTREQARTLSTHLARQAVKTGVLYEAIEDFVRRGYDALGDAPDSYRVQEWVESERFKAPHLFAGQGRQESGTPNAPRPTPQTTDYMAIPDPAARLTAFRADQEKAQKQGAQP